MTSLTRDAQANNDFFTKTLGLRRVKKTVNFDAPDVYHLYYGDETGTPGSIMTYFPFPHIAHGRPGTGEVSTTAFAVPRGSLGYWQDRLQRLGVDGLKQDAAFGESRLRFAGIDGDGFALVETADDTRVPWLGGGVGVGEETAIRGFHSVSLRLRDDAATAELLKFMGYKEIQADEGIKRFAIDTGNGANIVDLETTPNIAQSREGAGSVHHVAFAVENRVAQIEVRKALADANYMVTPVIDRDYFWSIYFRTPDGVLFEVATNEPGFARDEDKAHLGEELRLPKQHSHLRAQLEALLPPIAD